MEIINHLGQTVLKQTYSNSIDVSNILNGIYILNKNDNIHLKTIDLRNKKKIVVKF